jgi:hypothetical protein
VKKLGSKAYLTAAVFTLLLSAAYSTHGWPLFIKWFVPFPKLEEAVVYEGTLHIEGKARSTNFGEVAPAYFIVGADGRHKIFWGLPGSEEDYFLGQDADFDRVTGKVWYHPIFGVIQDEFMATPAMIEKYSTFKKTPMFGQRYATGPKLSFEKYFNYEKYYWNLFPTLVGLILTVYYFIQYRKTKQIEKGSQHG